MLLLSEPKRAELLHIRSEHEIDTKDKNMTPTRFSSIRSRLTAVAVSSSRQLSRVLALLAITLLITSCSTLRFPGVHRITIQQGNVISQSMVDKLKPGMTKSQVRYVMGNPILDDNLDRNRWDYVYSIQLPNTTYIKSKLQVYFVDERLSYFEGDYAPTEIHEERAKQAAAELSGETDAKAAET